MYWFQTAGFQNLTKNCVRGGKLEGLSLQLMVYFFLLRVVGHLQFMVELCLICSVYYDFIPHALLAGLTPSSLALFSHKSFPSEFPCSLPAVEQLGRYRKTQTAPKGCSQGHGLAVEPGFSWSSLDDGLHHPISSRGGDVLRSCGLQTRSLLFACLSNPASLKAEMFSLPQRRSRECWLFLLSRNWSFYP